MIHFTFLIDDDGIYFRSGVISNIAKPDSFDKLGLPTFHGISDDRFIHGEIYSPSSPDHFRKSTFIVVKKPIIITMECDFNQRINHKELKFYNKLKQFINYDHSIVLPNDKIYTNWYPCITLFYMNQCQVTFG